MKKVSESKYADLVRRIRDLHEANGFELYYNADQYGYGGMTSENEVEFEFYHDGLSHVRTPEGTITPLVSRLCGDVEKVFELLVTEFGLEYVRSTNGLIGEMWHYYKANKGLPE